MKYRIPFFNNLMIGFHFSRCSFHTYVNLKINKSKKIKKNIDEKSFIAKLKHSFAQYYSIAYLADLRTTEVVYSIYLLR